MDIGAQTMSKDKGKGKEKRYCQICAGKGKSRASGTHNTVDCYDKPGKESKRPAQKKATSSSSSSSNTKNDKRKNLQARLAELAKEIDELDDDTDTTTSPVGTVHVNTARIEVIDDPVLAETGADGGIDDRQPGPSRGRRSQMDFPSGM